ncbi:serine protease [Actinoplanes bogorensis]|uniref:Serine protease n=1 Tax=Paractinoplanes bogorensis TaxID=1610840 RepID=A0ABS5YHR0_9ACTN|nr:serine protease [Actinoplanes bogorensis]MBU2662881.1 serine protease [Actinoplanes bogorensis]
MVRNAASLVLAVLVAATLAFGDQPAARAGLQAQPVVGGLVAPQGKFPWAVRLSMGCGGALTEPRIVLTAGHCVEGTGKNDHIEVTAGVSDLKSSSAQTARSERVIRAEGFIDETRGDDWALIRLDRPLRLPTLPLAEDAVGTGRYVVMGWGQTREDSIQQEQQLHYATVPTVPDAKCAAAYQKAGVKLVPDEMMCAGSPGVDTCQGDSGGPMIGHGRHGEWVQVGIVSWGLGCARDGYPGVYTQLSTFRPAIKAALRRLR